MLQNMMVDFAIPWLKWIPPTRECSTTCCKVKACNIIGSHYYMFPLFFFLIHLFEDCQKQDIGGKAWRCALGDVEGEDDGCVYTCPGRIM